MTYTVIQFILMLIGFTAFVFIEKNEDVCTECVDASGTGLPLINCGSCDFCGKPETKIADRGSKQSISPLDNERGMSREGYGQQVDKEA